MLRSETPWRAKRVSAGIKIAFNMSVLIMIDCAQLHSDHCFFYMLSAVKWARVRMQILCADSWHAWLW